MTSENLSANQFTSALSKSTLSEKCQGLTKLIEESNPKLLHQNFPALVQHIFGVDMPGWGIQHINPRQRSFECNLLREFLGYKGPVFRLVNKLQAESMLFRYDFPCSLLPPTFVYMPGDQLMSQQRIMRQIQNISVGTTQFANGTGASSLKGQTCIRVSAFEFYFYHFAHCIFSSIPPPVSSQPLYGYHQLPPSPDENLYFLLVDDYLAYFLPLDGSCPPSMRTLDSTPQTSMRVPATRWIPHVSSMLRKTPLKQTNSLGVTPNEIWRSDLLVHILVEFWLGHFVQPVEHRNTMPPSEDLIRAVRRLVKHMHYFVNSHSSSLVLSHMNDSVMDQFKQNIMCNCLQPRLFEFLCYCFDIWPLNSTFRIVLETWLSYIQPWRYVNVANAGKNAEQRLNDDREIANIWYHFILNNLHFYNKLFHSSITRFLRMDISRQANSLLLYRVAKIFSQPNLLAMIEEAEATNFGIDKTLMYPQNLGSYLSGSRSAEGSISRPSYLFTSEDLRKVVNQLLIVCKQALGTVKKNTIEYKENNTNRLLKFIGLGSLAAVGADNSVTTDSSWKKSEQQIKDAMHTLAEMFDLAIPELDLSVYWQSDCDNPLGPDAPDCYIDEEGNVRLTDLGRYEIMNNIKKPNILPNSDTELQPITSFENKTLVRFFYAISSKLNMRYGAYFQQLCSHDDFFGKLARYFLSSHEVDYSTSVPVQTTSTRLSLRFLAHYQTIFYLFLYFCVIKIFGISLVSSVFYLILACFVYCVLKFLVLEYTRKS